MLAGFYASAVLLRFEYPMMIVTRTRDIFLKRLKKNKKMLTEEGSSDESRSKTLSRSIQLHTNTFLDSVNSSQLSKKTAQLRDQLFPEFRQMRDNDKSYDPSIHDIHNPLPSFDNSIVQKRESILSEQSFADKLMKLSKNISLNQMIDSETVQVNLSPVESDISYMICDFDDIDRDATIQNYQKLILRQKENLNYQQNGLQQDDYSGDRFKKKSKMMVTPIEQTGKYLNHQKTLQNPRSRRLPKQMQYSAIQRQLKSRPMHYQQNYNNTKMSAFYQTKNSLIMDTEAQRIDQHQQSYRTLQKFRPSNSLKANEHQLKHVYNNCEGYGGNRGKANSYQDNYLPRHRSNNVFNIKKPQETFKEYDDVSKKSSDYQLNIQQTDPYHRKEHKREPEIHYHQRHTNHQQIHSRYSIKNKPNQIDERFVTEFNIIDHNQRINSPRFASLKQQEAEQQKFGIYSKHNSKLYSDAKVSHLPMTNQKYFISGLQKNGQNTYRNVQERRSPAYQQQSHRLYQQNFEDKLQKKKKIRQKAAQLLSRVKSHEYLTTRGQMPYTKRY